VINKRVVWTFLNRKFSVQIPFLAFVSFAILLCLSLANWQWQRAQAADSLFASYQLQESRPVSVLSDSPEPYQRVTLSGYIKKHFFLDNQILQGVAGWAVIAEVETKQFNVLVNLGWQPKQKALTLASELPSYLEVQGLIRTPQQGFMLQEAKEDPNWPTLQQQIDIDLLSEYFGYHIFPFVLYAENQVTNLIPMPIKMENKFIMHVGYAIQWLLIALACLIGFLYVSRSEQQENE
jgi:cytochrome oxidase assembly protein ShyY1